MKKRKLNKKLVAELMEILFSSSESESDTDSSTSSSDLSGSEGDYEENVVMETWQQYSDEDFKTYFGMTRATISYLTELYKQSSFSSGDKTSGRRPIGSEREVYMFVWYMCNADTFRVISNKFGTSLSCAWYVINRVAEWLISISKNYVRWPRGEALHKTESLFKAKGGIPGVIGSIDTLNILIQPPMKNKLNYFDAKKNYSIVLQAVVDSEYKFTDIYCGEPGSLDNNSVLKRSALYKATTTESTTESFPLGTFLLAGQDYQSMQWIVAPYKCELTAQHECFNSLHLETRNVVQTTFQMMKRQFKRLQCFKTSNNVNFIVNIVACACILHNICTLRKDLYGDPPEKENIIVPVQKTERNLSTPHTNRQEEILAYLIANDVIVND